MKIDAPTIREYMTASPCTIRVDQTLKEAHDLMAEQGIRHLPVLEGDMLVGILSERDLHVVEALSDVAPAKVPVQQVMMRDVFTVVPDARLDDVALDMAENKLGSAVVTKQGRVVGIFTAVDALRALGTVLRRAAV